MSRRTATVEPAKPEKSAGLTARIQDFWTAHVNAEKILGKDVTRYARGTEDYFQDLEQQRYRSHRHLMPWIRSMERGRSVLEIGSGVGLDTYTIARHGLEVTAIDLTQVAVNTASQRFKRSEVPGAFAVADAVSLPFPDNVFDYVYSFGVLHHAADTNATIQEAYRVLKPGGEARIMLYHRRSLNEVVHRLTGIPFEDKDAACPVVRRFTIPEVRDMFRQFSTVETRLDYVYGEGYGRIFSLTPRWLYDWLSHRVGWHIMISAKK